MANNSALRVLIVEDDALLRWALVETLTAVGHTVVEAVDGAGALGKVRDASVPFDVVLLDCCLPDCDGLTLLANIHRLTPTSAVVLMAPVGDSDVAPRARRLGAAGVLDKPFDMHLVNGALMEAAGRGSTP